jgi:hypothetical protein
MFGQSSPLLREFYLIARQGLFLYVYPVIDQGFNQQDRVYTQQPVKPMSYSEEQTLK